MGGGCVQGTLRERGSREGSNPVADVLEVVKPIRTRCRAAAGRTPMRASTDLMRTAR